MTHHAGSCPSTWAMAARFRRFPTASPDRGMSRARVAIDSGRPPARGDTSNDDDNEPAGATAAAALLGLASGVEPSVERYNVSGGHFFRFR